MVLVTVLDQNLNVVRGAFDQSVAGSLIGASLLDHAVHLKRELERVQGVF